MNVRKNLRPFRAGSVKGVFRGAIELLENADPTLAWPQYQDDPEHQYRAFCTLLSRAAKHCTINQFDDLFYTMVESREMARKIRKQQ
ncbi:MAG: hypothetical protein AAFQ57_01250 [Cyanobacteria bacterium J06626_14]